MAKLRLSGLVFGMVVLGSVAVTAADARQRPPATYRIVIDKMAFGAAPPGLHVGDTIIWVNRDLFRHTATAADRSFNVDLAPGKSASITLTRAGKVAFACTFHPGMKGVLTISP
jgi:plastocyanin